MFDFVRMKLSEGGDILKHPSFDSGKRTVVFLHGFSEKPSAHLTYQSIYILATGYETPYYLVHSKSLLDLTIRNLTANRTSFTTPITNALITDITRSLIN